MPTSTNYFKKETKDYIIKKYSKDSNILDIGAGIGTYSNLLKPLGYNNIDCVEVFEKYVNDYSLRSKYRNVFLGDITKLGIDFTQYDLIIFGDVLEHIEKSDAVKLLSKINNIPSIICVPFESPQGEHFGNIYETHLQPDLTFENFLEFYNGYHPLCIRFDYGVFINEIPTEIFFEVGEKQLPNNYLKFVVKNYPDSEYVYLNPQPKTESIMKINDSKVTIVTGLWDLGRGKIGDSFKRSYDNYLEKFGQLLKTDINMYIFCDPSDEEFIWKHRNKENTIINKMTLSELLVWFNFTNLTNEIRQKEEWLSQSSWLKESPQAILEAYNPLVMSKMFMLNNVTIWNPFNSDYFFWIDAGITNTVHYGYFTHDKVFNNLPEFINKRINQLNGIYYGYLSSSLNEGYMGTEESIFSIMLYNHPELITQYNIKGDGLVWPFFEDLKDKEYKKNVKNITSNSDLDINKTSLYVIGFNSPKQLETLIESMVEYDKSFIEKPKKYLLNNSTDRLTDQGYKELCDKYDFTIIDPGSNLGICGGRQYIAEHFDRTDSDFMFFFEDDMFFYPKKGEVCKNGFNRYVDNLYSKSLKIIQKENFDFLKLNFTEFFGDNSIQWSWYNTPQSVREQLWPTYSKLPQQGLDPNAPKAKYSSVRSLEGIPYVTGEVYYCNWPQIVSKEGNKKMFLDTKWAHPFEQTWMSYMYQETVKGNITPGLLLMTPTEHNRFDHYSRELRKES